MDTVAENSVGLQCFHGGWFRPGVTTVSKSAQSKLWFSFWPLFNWWDKVITTWNPGLVRQSERHWDCITSQQPIQKKNNTFPRHVDVGHLLWILQRNSFFPKWLNRGIPKHNSSTESQLWAAWLLRAQLFTAQVSWLIQIFFFKAQIYLLQEDFLKDLSSPLMQGKFTAQEQKLIYHHIPVFV